MEGTKENVLDQGYVKLINVNLTEKDISKIAGLSYKSKKGPDVKKLLDLDHMSPFEFASVTFRVKAPIFVARQWMRHRTGRYLEKSLRYTEAEPEFYLGDSRFSDESIEDIKNTFKELHELYQDMLNDEKMPKELARTVLPVSLYTEFYFQLDIRNLINFLKLRLDKSAQYEIREYAKTILNLIKPHFPSVYEHLIKE